MRRVLIATLVLALAAGQPCLAEHWEATKPIEATSDVPVEHWGYNAMDYLMEQGLRCRYPATFFHGAQARMRIEFRAAIGDMQGFMADKGNRKYLKVKETQQIDTMLATLHAEFWHVAGYLVGESTVVTIPAAKVAATSPYDDVPVTDWAYHALAYMAGKGILEGYPYGFFDGKRVLVRYEFAQATARLLDTIDKNVADEPTKIIGEALRHEFADELEHLHSTGPGSM